MLNNIARRILPSTIKDVLQVYNPLQLSTQILKLGIVDSGIDEENTPYIKINTGKLFYGVSPSGLEKLIYKYTVTDKSKKSLPEYAFRVAMDIIYRYRGTESSPICSGKYYSFQSGETIVECGAYLGYYSMKAAEIVGPGGKVIAIEPIKENLQILKKNVKENNIENISIVPKGIWDRPQSRRMSREKRQRASLIDGVVKSNENLSIICDSIDNILQEFNVDQIGFIRIQVNGAELEALGGMRETLPKTKRILVSALYKRDGRYAYKTVAEILARNGFITSIRNGNVFGYRE